MDGKVGKADRSKQTIVMSNFTPTERKQVHSLTKRGICDRKAVYRIRLDKTMYRYVTFLLGPNIFLCTKAIHEYSAVGNHRHPSKS
jgi:hypothetical protein